MSELLIKGKNMRLFLNSYFYSSLIIDKLLDHIRNTFNVFNIEYNDSSRCINIKIKKSEIKRISDYNHESQFYIRFFNRIFITFFMENKEFLTVIFNSKNNTESLSIDDLFNEQIVSLMYNLLTTNDNIITIYL